MLEQGEGLLRKRQLELAHFVTPQIRASCMNSSRFSWSIPQRFPWAVGLVLAAIPMFAQLMMGANVLMVLTSGVVCVLGFSAIQIYGVYNAGSLLLFLYVANNIWLACYSKILFGQTLGSNLLVPIEAVATILVGTVELFAAFALVNSVPVGRPLLRPRNDPKFLQFLSIACFLIGLLFWALNLFYSRSVGLVGVGAQGFGGFAQFNSLFYMGIISGTASVLVRSGGRRSISVMVLAMLMAELLMGLTQDAKTNVALPFVSYLLTTIFYRRVITARQVAFFLIGGILFVFVFAPAVHYYRIAGILGVSLRERITYLEEHGSDLLSLKTLEQYQNEASENLAKSQSYYNYFGEGHQMLLGRLASIQQIDPIIAETDRQGTLGGSVIWPAFERLLPSFIDAEKPVIIEASQIVSRFGLVRPSYIGFPTVPLVAQAYAGYGTLGLFVFPFFTFFVFLLILKKIGWTLYRNVYGIFFFSSFIFINAAQWSFSQYIGATLRGIPLLAVVLLALEKGYRTYHRRGLFFRPSRS